MIPVVFCCQPAPSPFSYMAFAAVQTPMPGLILNRGRCQQVGWHPGPWAVDMAPPAGTDGGMVVTPSTREPSDLLTFRLGLPLFSRTKPAGREGAFGRLDESFEAAGSPATNLRGAVHVDGSATPAPLPTGNWVHRG